MDLFPMQSTRYDHRQSMWGHPRFYLSWRIFWALIHTSWLVISLVTASKTLTSPSLGVAVWFIYLSNWTYLLLTVSTVTDKVMVLYVIVKRQDIVKGISSHLPWYLRISWLLSSVVTEGSLHISAFYWIFVFKDHELTLLRFLLHGVNSIYVLSNLLLTVMPVRVYHVIYPIIYGVIYTVLSVVYHIFGGISVNGEPYKFIYKVLDWPKWKKTLPLVCLSTFVALACLYLVIYFLHVLRRYIHTRYYREEHGILESSPERTNNGDECLEKQMRDHNYAWSDECINAIYFTKTTE